MTTTISKNLVSGEFVTATGDEMTGELTFVKTGAGVVIKTTSDTDAFTGHHIQWSDGTLAVSLTKAFNVGTMTLSHRDNVGAVKGGLIFDASGDIRTLKSVPPMANDLSIVHKKYVDTAANEVPAPATATSTGTTGNIAFDSSFFYVCIATDQWRRIAHSSW